MSEKGKLVSNGEQEHSYGSSEPGEETNNLEHVYEKIATIVPILRCEWQLDIVWETMINVSSFFFSAIAGAILGKLPDIYGRRFILLIFLVSLFITTCASALAQTKLQFLITRCLVGVCMGVTFPTAITFSTEIVRSKNREIGPSCITAVCNLSVFGCAVLAWLLLNKIGWRWFIVLNAIPLIPGALFLFFLPESPRYLVTSGQDAASALTWMAARNGVTLAPADTLVTIHQEAQLGAWSDVLSEKFRKETILLSAIFFGNLLILFGLIVFVPLALYSGFCGGDQEAPVHKCVGPAQYLYWTCLSVITYFDFSEMVVIATIVPILRCEWQLDIVWETMINVSSFFFSAIAGAILGKLPDIYGRRFILLIFLVSLFITTCASALAQTKLQFLITRCLVGVCMGVTFPTAITFSTEIVRSKNREIGPSCITAVCNLSVFGCAVLAWLLLNKIGWRWFIVLNAIPLIGTRNKNKKEGLSGSMNQTSGQDAASALTWMAARNGVTLARRLWNHSLYSGFCGGDQEAPVHKCEEVDQGSLLRLALITSGAVFSTFAAYIAAVTLGRKVSLRIFSTGGFISTIFLYRCFSKIFTVVVFFVIKFLQTSHNVISLIIVPEYYPTAFRNAAIGFINSWGKLGGVIGAGLVYVLFYISPYLVVGMFSSAALLVMACSWIWDKETKDTKMSDVIEEQQIS
eukprot:sb/3462658/